MAHAVRQGVAPPRKKTKKKVMKVEPEEECVFEDVVTFPVPRKRLFASFPIDVDPDKLRRRTPHVVFEPELQDE